MKAFVKVVDAAEATHLKPEARIFYRVCYTDGAGVLWDLLNHEDYPFVWGFSKFEHALKVARNNNADYDTGSGNATLARKLGNVEREEGVPNE